MRHSGAVACAILGAGCLLGGGCRPGDGVSLRRFPYPYRAALAISSDIDETTSCEEFLAIQTYLCTRDSTPLGPGLGLEVGNSFWFYDWTGRSAFTYFAGRSDEPSGAAPLIECMVRAGYVDVLHSYGDFSEGGFGRDMVGPCVRVLSEWRDRGYPVRTWVNHGDDRNRQALGTLPYERGDDPGAPEYHADLLLPTGVEYVEMWEVTHVVGQDRALAPGDWAKDGASALVYALNRLRGRPQTQPRLDNSLFRVATLDDGSRALSFRRFLSPGRFQGADVWNLPGQLSPGVIQELKSRGGSMILYTHLGGNEGLAEYLPPAARETLAAVAEAYRAGEIFVTTSTRLLDYRRMREGVEWNAVGAGDSVTVVITGVDDPLGRWARPDAERLQGLTFYVPRAGRAAVLMGGTELAVERNPADGTGRESVTIPWVPLSFPAGAPGTAGP
jgi:hypothetical protein